MYHIPSSPSAQGGSIFHGLVLPPQREEYGRNHYLYTNGRWFSDKHQDKDHHHSATSDGDSLPTMRERAEQHARNIRKSSAKAARKGAKSAGAMAKQYGPVFIGTYFTIYWSFLALLYGGVDSGLVDPLTVIQFIKSNSTETTETTITTVEYVVGIMNHYSLTAPYAPYIEKNPHFANLGVAWIGVKFTEPVRLALTIAVVPRLARYFGFVKKDEEDDIVHETKGEETPPAPDSKEPAKKE